MYKFRDKLLNLKYFVIKWIFLDFIYILFDSNLSYTYISVSVLCRTLYFWEWYKIEKMISFRLYFRWKYCFRFEGGIYATWILFWKNVHVYSKNEQDQNFVLALDFIVFRVFFHIFFHKKEYFFKWSHIMNDIWQNLRKFYIIKSLFSYKFNQYLVELVKILKIIFCFWNNTVTYSNNWFLFN